MEHADTVQKYYHTLFCFSFNQVILHLHSISPAKKDSTNLYKNIESFSKRSKFTKFMYIVLIFKPVAPVSQKKKVKKKGYKKLIQKPYSAFEGKTIRHIIIETLDPFGYSIADTSVKSQNFFLKAGNTAACEIPANRHSKPFAYPAKPTIRFIAC